MSSGSLYDSAKEGFKIESFCKGDSSTCSFLCAAVHLVEV